MKKLAVIVVVMLLVAFCGGYAFGLNIYSKTLDAIGTISITDEVEIYEIEIEDEGKVKVQCEPTTNTQPDVTYSVHLILDGAGETPQPLSWSAAEITAVTKKTATFASLDLGSVTSVRVEVTH